MTDAPESHTASPRWPVALLCLCGGLFSLGVAVLTVFEDWLFASAYLSQSTWQSLMIALGGQLEADGEGAIYAARLESPEFVLLATALFGGLIWAIGSWLAVQLSGRGWGEVAVTWAARGGRWLLLLLLWSQGRMIAYLIGADWLQLALATTSEFYWAIVFGLVALEWWPLTLSTETRLLETPGEADDRFARRIVWGAFAVYSLVSVAMNWGLWFNLRIPHGDSAMYEEHLWNLTHGKGFRSYLDQGLFLGEHIQVIHLALLPLHWLWPSHLLLELCQSLGIAAVVFPLYSIAKRHTGQPRWAAGVAILAVLAFPVHYLDISIDVKTFRPTALGVAIVLAAIDAFEAKSYRRLLIWVLLGLSVQEDFALVFGPLGLWFAWDGWRKHDRAQKWLGLGLLVGSAAYLLLVMKVLLPYFREGVTIHYASYFAKFGATPGEIVWNMLTRPGLVWESLATANSLSYFLCLIVPLGLLPLLSLSRLLTAAPLFVLLCLNELALQPPGPFHHFHAPIWPLLLWAAAAGLGRLSTGRTKLPPSREPLSALPEKSGSAGALPSRMTVASWLPTGGAVLTFSLTCGLWTGCIFSFGPLSFRFWDPGKPEYWRSRYIADERPAQFAQIVDLIPQTARVASTDFVHPRFTHFERSYDYSQYRRKISGDTTAVPDDTDYIVIDTRHPYSRIHGPEDVRELQTEPEKWQLLPDQTAGYFLVLKRKAAADSLP